MADISALPTTQPPAGECNDDDGLSSISGASSFCEPDDGGIDDNGSNGLPGGTDDEEALLGDLPELPPSAFGPDRLTVRVDSGAVGASDADQWEFGEGDGWAVAWPGDQD